MSRWPYLAVLLLLAGCGEDEVTGIKGTRVFFDTSSEAGFFDAPFPTMARLNADGTLRVGDFPNPTYNGMVETFLEALVVHG